MALLYYRNLGVHRPDILMDRAFRELKTFYNFLKRTRDYLQDATVKRLAWRPGEAPANGRHDPGRDAGADAGTWVELTEPPDRPNEPETTFRVFLDEAVNVEACLADARIRDACVDAFMAARTNVRHRRTAAVVTEAKLTGAAYRTQCAARGVTLAVADRDALDEQDLRTADIVIGTSRALERRTDELPLDIATVRGPENTLHVVRRRAAAWSRLDRRTREGQPRWASEAAWRLASLYEQRMAERAGDPGGDRRANEKHPLRTRAGIADRAERDGKRRTTAERLHQEVENLFPAAETGVEPDQVRQEIDRVRRVALPSVLESLRHGFERNAKQRTGSALSDGLPPKVLAPRHVLLSWQHRMHPEIAAFSHEHVYEGEALRTPDYMEAERAWSYSRYAYRAVWRDVRGRFDGRFNCNKDEARSVADELGHFDAWARGNPRDDGRPWEAAVLTFYRGQEREVRSHLRRWTRQHRATRHFARGPKNRPPYLRIELCTVDRFQGHEADLVLISFARSHPTSFLESPNRLNVALTRARYQRVVIGDRQAMRGAREGPLKTLADNERWEKDVRREERR